tara:strand:- start:454 stop:702 length:249 start_codon:yes stop_codon:yes gene_type:complete
MNKTEAVQKGVETMKMSDNNVVKEKVIKAEDLKVLIENLTIQFNEFNRIANEHQTRAIETRGAIAVATAQLQGLEDDTKPTD